MQVLLSKVNRSSRPEAFCKNIVLRFQACNFIKKETLAHRATLLKKRLQHRCFPMNFAKSLRILFFIEHLRWLLLDKFINRPNAVVAVYVHFFNFIFFMNQYIVYYIFICIYMTLYVLLWKYKHMIHTGLSFRKICRV